MENLILSEVINFYSPENMISVDVEVNYFACIRLILEAKVDKDFTGEVPRIKNKK